VLEIAVAITAHPLSNVRRWRASLDHGNGKCSADSKRDAMAAWRRFVSCMKSLPPDQAAPFWQTVQAQAAAHLIGGEFVYRRSHSCLG
jgi:hypothetical protein